MHTFKIKNKNGYALLELLFYISLFAVLFIVVIDAMITMTHAFRETTLQSEFLQSGSILEKMSREIRQAIGINSISSSDLKLNTTDSNGASKIVEFVLSGTDVQFLENNLFTGNLNTPNIIVTGLAFTQITTAKGEAVKIVLSVRSSNDASARIQNFYDTIVLRGSY